MRCFPDASHRSSCLQVKSIVFNSSSTVASCLLYRQLTFPTRCSVASLKGLTDDETYKTNTLLQTRNYSVFNNSVLNLCGIN